jgi:hypothetical protein
MTFAEKQIITKMKEISQERPETATPSPAFVRDWAYGNAGIEDERITLEQVEQVLRSKE